MKNGTSRIVDAIILTSLISGSVLFCGCISSHETVYHNPERVKVEFENETTARIFYEALSRTPGANRHESDTSFEIPVVFQVHTHVVEGENVAFNAAVHECDTNRDGKITEMEARIFAERHK